jgi:hypothetical protein
VGYKYRSFYKEYFFSLKHSIHVYVLYLNLGAFCYKVHTIHYFILHVHFLSLVTKPTTGLLSFVAHEASERKTMKVFEDAATPLQASTPSR